MKYIISFINLDNGSTFTCEAFPCDGKTAEQSMKDCINHFIPSRCRLESIKQAELDGTEESIDEKELSEPEYLKDLRMEAIMKRSEYLHKVCAPAPFIPHSHY